MPGSAGADRLVLSGARAAARITGGHADHALDVLEHSVNAPEAAASQDGVLIVRGRLRRGRSEGVARASGQEQAHHANEPDELPRRSQATMTATVTDRILSFQRHVRNAPTNQAPVSAREPLPTVFALVSLSSRRPQFAIDCARNREPLFLVIDSHREAKGY